MRGASRPIRDDDVCKKDKTRRRDAFYVTYLLEYKYTNPMINGKDTAPRNPKAAGRRSLSGFLSN
jgi:hypothetical protein